MSKTNVSETYANVLKEFDEFLDEIASLKTESILSDINKIHFYINVAAYFSDNPKVVKYLTTLKYPLNELYYFYLKYEHIKYDSYEEIEEMITEFDEYFKCGRIKV